MIKHPASRSLCSLTSSILSHIIHSLQLPASSIPNKRKATSHHRSRRDREVADAG